MKVKNVSGTSDRSVCSCGTWLAHWTKFSKVIPTECSVAGCANSDIVGGHVRKVSKTDRKEYIVPICNFHNHYTIDEPMDLVPKTKLVRANKSETCEKKKKKKKS